VIAKTSVTAVVPALMNFFATVAAADTGFVSKNVAVFTNDAPTPVVIVIVLVPETPSAITLIVRDSTPITENERPVVVPSLRDPGPATETVIVSLAATPAAD